MAVRQLTYLVLYMWARERLYILCVVSTRSRPAASGFTFNVAVTSQLRTLEAINTNFNLASFFSEICNIQKNLLNLFKLNKFLEQTYNKNVGKRIVHKTLL